MLIGLMVAGCRTRQEQDSAPPTPAPASQASTTNPAGPDKVWVTVRSETLRQYVPAIGSLRARQSTRVGSQVSGRVQEVLVDVGDRVTKDQVLVRLDAVLFEIEVQQNQGSVEAARGALASAAADVVYCEHELARHTGLYELDAAARKELDDARTAYERAVGTRDEKQGKLSEAEEELAYARQRLAEAVVRAPYDGVITERMVDPGDMVSATPATELLEVREVGVLYLEFSLPQELLGVVRAGTPVEFEVEGTGAGTGRATVGVVFPAIDEATRSFRCRVVLVNDEHQWQPGMLARVRVVEREAPHALVVPTKALARSADGWQVYVSNRGHPVRRGVQVGLQTDALAEVSAGLAAGDQVLAEADLARSMAGP